MPASEAVWKERFEGGLNAHLDAWGRSIGADAFLWKEEVQASRAYARALWQAGVLSEQEWQVMAQGLDEVIEAFEAGADLSAYEDIHSAVELMLTDRIGEAGRKLHTGRSRNEQVAADERLWLMGRLKRLQIQVGRIQQAVLDLAEQYKDVVMPGYTHLQQGQPVLFSFYIMTLFWQMEDHRRRLEWALESADVLPLGSGALAGCNVALDREAIAAELGFSRVSSHAMHAVSSRSFILDSLHACGMLLLDLSRFAEDSIVFSSREFAYLLLDDAVATSSSLMPQKRNGDFYELLRAESARAFAAYSELFVTLKGLPLTYNKDMQNDKRPLVYLDGVAASLESAEVLLRHYRLDCEKIKQALDPAMLATDAAHALTEQGLPFREAHGVAGALVREAEKLGVPLNELDLSALGHLTPGSASGLALPDFEASVRAKKTAGSTHPGAVAEMMSRARDLLAERL